MNEMYYSDYLNSIYSYEPNSYNSQNVSYEPRDFQYRNESNDFYNENRASSFFNPVEGFAKGNMQADIYKPYKILNPSVPVAHNERERLLLEVQKYSFAMWDLNLFLNTHPTDRNAMKLYDTYKTSYKEALIKYESKYCGLVVNDSKTNEGYWEWNKSPWPWEVE